MKLSKLSTTCVLAAIFFQEDSCKLFRVKIQFIITRDLLYQKFKKINFFNLRTLRKLFLLLFLSSDRHFT